MVRKNRDKSNQPVFNPGLSRSAGYRAAREDRGSCGTTHSGPRLIPDGGSQQSIKDMLSQETGGSVFVDPSLVDPDTIIDEDRIVGRNKQLESVVSYLRPTLEGNRAPNMLLYGPAGTGKSLIIRAVTQQILELYEPKPKKFGAVHINCQAIGRVVGSFRIGSVLTATK